MNRVLAALATVVIGVIGFLYFMELDEVGRAKASAQSALNIVSITLKSDRSVEDERIRQLFDRTFTHPDIDVTEVRQSVQEATPGELRRSITIKGRAKTTLSRYFNMDGAEIALVASQDLDK